MSSTQLKLSLLVICFGFCHSQLTKTPKAIFLLNLDTIVNHDGKDFNGDSCKSWKCAVTLRVCVSFKDTMPSADDKKKFVKNQRSLSTLAQCLKEGGKLKILMPKWKQRLSKKGYVYQLKWQSTIPTTKGRVLTNPLEFELNNFTTFSYQIRIYALLEHAAKHHSGTVGSVLVDKYSEIIDSDSLVAHDRPLNVHLNGERHIITQTQQPASDFNFTASIICADGYFGCRCEYQCVDGATYACDTDTGEKICSKHYYGTDCSVNCEADFKKGTVCDESGTRLCMSGYTDLKKGKCTMKDCDHLTIKCPDGKTCKNTSPYYNEETDSFTICE